MINPWRDIPVSPPYVLPSDRPYVEEFNAQLHPDHPNRLHLDCLPVPFHGFHSAPVVLLSRNPRYFPEAFVEEEQSPQGRSLLLANLQNDGGAPHPGMMKDFAGTKGGQWWANCFRGVTKKLDCSLDSLAGKVLAVEFHGYRSRSWTALPITLPSSWYGFQLVAESVERGAVVIVLRGLRDWEVAVPGLREYDRRIVSSNPRRSSISPKACGDKFPLVLEALS